MSFDVYVIAVPINDGDQEGPKFERSIVENAFQSMAVNQDTDYWHIRDLDGAFVSATLFVDVDPMITIFSSNRPPSYAFPQFWEAIYAVLRQTWTMICWPADEDETQCCVANEEILATWPESMKASLGVPVVVRSGAEITKAIGFVEG